MEEQRKNKKKKAIDYENNPVELASAKEILGARWWNKIKKLDRGEEKQAYLEELASVYGMTQGVIKILGLVKQYISKWMKEEEFYSATIAIKRYYFYPLYAQSYKEAFETGNWRQRVFLMDNQPAALGDGLFDISDIDFSKGNIEIQLMNFFMQAISSTKDPNIAKSAMILMTDTALKFREMELAREDSNTGEGMDGDIVSGDEFKEALLLVKSKDSESLAKELENAHLKREVAAKKKDINRRKQEIEDAVIEEDENEEKS